MKCTLKRFAQNHFFALLALSLFCIAYPRTAALACANEEEHDASAHQEHSKHEGKSHKGKRHEGKKHEGSTHASHTVQVIQSEGGSIEMKIQGLACSSCVKRLETALRQVKGVNKATVSLERQTVLVETTDPKIREAIEEAARAAGFVPKS